MKKFIVQLFSNRFGIVLATLNVCYLASKGNDFMARPFGKLFVCTNFPAAVSAIFSLEFLEIFIDKIPSPAITVLGNTFFTFFIILQWLFIAWIARTIAQKFRSKEL